MGKSVAKPTLVTDNRERVLKELQELSDGCSTVNLVVLVSGLTAPPTGMEHTLVALQKLATEANEKDSTSRTLIYRSVVNFDNKSKDGIIVCGKRLADEVNELVERTKAQQQKTIKLSLLGNSFGGLVARAALADIHWEQSNVIVVPKIFSTTMSPHLGSRDSMHTKLPKPVLFALINFLGVTLGTTGKDLMRQNDTLGMLASDPKYMEPLGRFEKRIAFSNSFRTDFRVATGTALFIAPDSESLHQTDRHFTQNFPFAVHALTTPKVKRREQPTPPSKNQWMREHCEKLDALGWTKVFCDIRSELPKVKVPFRRRRKKKQSSTESDNITTNSSASSHGEDTWTAAQLCRRYCRDDPATRGTWYNPQGHSVLMVNPVTAPEGNYLMKGMPFVKEYAARTMQDVLDNTSDSNNGNDNLKVTESWASSPSLEAEPSFEMWL